MPVYRQHCLLQTPTSGIYGEGNIGVTVAAEAPLPPRSEWGEGPEAGGRGERGSSLSWHFWIFVV